MAFSSKAIAGIALAASVPAAAWVFMLSLNQTGPDSVPAAAVLGLLAFASVALAGLIFPRR